MKTKRFLLGIFSILMATTSVNVYATQWFVKENATGSDGKSWENAFNLSQMMGALNYGNVAADDVIHFAGGTYRLGVSDQIYVSEGIKIIGGYSNDLKGTDAPDLTYPTATPTILTGDINSTGTNADGNCRNIFYLDKVSEPIYIQGFNLSNCYYTGNNAYEAGAICSELCTNVTVADCVIDKNTVTQKGAAGITNSGSTMHIVDCEFTNNTANEQGGAFRNAARTNSATGVKMQPMTVFERCLFTGNKLNVASGKYGAAIQMNQGNVWVLNSTITNNEAFSHGAGIAVNTDCVLYVMSSTFASNICHASDATNLKSGNGASIRNTGNGKVYIANTISVENNYTAKDGVGVDWIINPTYFHSGLGTLKPTDVYLSSGNNLMGIFNIEGFTGATDLDNLWTSTDKCNIADNTAQAIFGSNQLANNGGATRTLIPLKNPVGANVDNLYQIAQGWAFPYDVDVFVDQRGLDRQETTSVGAYDVNVAGVEENTIGGEDITLTSQGNGVFTVNGIESGINVYDLSGRCIQSVKGNVMDLSNYAKGIYILSTAKKTFKVMR